jgi:hypothetical protein
LIKIIIKSANWIFGILIFVLLIEAFSFFASKLELMLFNGPPGAYSRIHSGNEWRTEKELWGAWHKLNIKADRHQKYCFDVTYESNDVGARDLIDYLTLVNNNNVAIIGDSFVEGYGLNLEDTFAYRLKKIYGKKGLNFGASGDFGPVQEYLLYKSLISKIPHNEVIYFFLPANDFVDNDGKNRMSDRYRPYFVGDDYKIVYPDRANPTEWFPSAKLKENISNFTVIEKIKNILVEYTWTANTIRTVRHLNKEFKSESKPQSKKHQNEDWSYFVNSEYIVNGTMTYVDKLFSEIPKNYPKTIIIIPTKQDLEYIENGLKYMQLTWYKKLQKIATNYDAKFIDLAKEKNYNLSMFHSCDGHWNKKGNETVLEIFLSLNSK